MANAQQLPATTATKVEEGRHIATMQDFLQRYRVPAGTREPDVVDQRYRIALDSPLPDFDTATARAYNATDNADMTRSMYALVCEPGTVQRWKWADSMLEIKNSGLVSLAAHGVAEISSLGSNRYVLVYDRPMGSRLSALLRSHKGKLSEVFIRERILTPIASVIHQLSEAGFSHGRVNLDNIYFKEFAILGECLSEPCGYSQPFYMEPVDRMICMPAGKGEGTPAQDYYAMAVLVMLILFGQDHFSETDAFALARRILREGAYGALVFNQTFPEIFYDLFCGVFNQLGSERWNYRYIKPWLEGKRFNLFTPLPPNEASRPFELGEISCNGRRELAHVLQSHWGKILPIIKDGTLAQWMTSSTQNKELTEAVVKLFRSASDSGIRSETQANDMAARMLILFDSQAPVRYQELSAHVDGMDTLLAELFLTNAQRKLQLFSEMVDLNLCGYWMEVARTRKSPHETVSANIINTLGRLEKIRQYLRTPGPGFGIERCIYTLDPQMPCLSPLLSGHYIGNVGDLIYTLDRAAPTLSRTSEPVDRHVAGYVASRLNIMQELRIPEFANIPTLATHRGILALKLFSLCAERAGHPVVPALCSWIAMQVLPALDQLHSKTLRGRMRDIVCQLAETGNIQGMYDLIVNTPYIVDDQVHFANAYKQYQVNERKISAFRGEIFLEEDTRRVGFVISKTIAYLACVTSIYKACTELRIW